MGTMKFAVTADLHYDLFQNISMLREDLLTDRADEIDQVFKQVIDHTVTQGIKYLFVIGDALHKRNIRSDAINGLLYRRLKYAKEQGIEVTLVVGNHDQAHVAGSVHAFETFKDVVRVVEEPEIITVEGFDFFCLSYEEYKGSKKSLELLLKRGKNPNRILMGHVGILGANLSGFDHISKEPLTTQDLQIDKFLYSYFGHYHLPQKVGKNAIYVGSPCQHSLNDKLVERGYVVGETKLEGTWKVVTTRCPIDSATFVEMDVDNYSPEKFEGKHYIKVTGCSRKQVVALQNDANVMSTTGERVETVVDENKVIQPELDWNSMVDRYIMITEPNIRKHRRLKKLGKEFISES